MFSIRHGADEGMRILWGDAGADRIYRTSAGGRANQGWVSPTVLLAMTVAGPRVDNVANLTPDMLGLGGFEVSRTVAIVRNPKAKDRFFADGARVNATTLAAGANLHLDDGGAGFNTRATDGFGPNVDVQAIFGDCMPPAPCPNMKQSGGLDHEETLIVNGQEITEGTWGAVWGMTGKPGLLMTLREASACVENFDFIPWWSASVDPAA